MPDSPGHIPVTTEAEEIRELKAHLRDLGACLALPALWDGLKQASIAEGLLDVLMSMLRLDFAHVRVRDPEGGAPLEAVRPQDGIAPERASQLLAGFNPQTASTVSIPAFTGSGTLNVTRVRVGLYEEGVVLAGARRAEFPTQLEQFLLGAIATQAALSLRAAKNIAQLASAANENARLYHESLESQRALQLSEDRYRGLLALLPVAVYTCEAPSGIISFYNEHATELWGRAPAIGEANERFCGSFKLWLPSGEFLPHSDTPMATALREGRSYRNEEVIMERPDGTRITVLVNIDPIHNDNGRVAGAINVFHDMTALKTAQDALRQSHAELLSRMDELSRFNRAAVGRELKMIELKKEVNDLCRRLGESPRYPLEFEQQARQSNG